MAYEGPHPFPISSGGTASTVLAPLVQVQYSTNTSRQTTPNAIPNNSIPQQVAGVGAEHITVSITPKNVNNVLYISYIIWAYIDAGTAQFVTALFQDSNLDAIYATECRAMVSGVNDIAPLYGYFTMPAGTTSPTTFKMRFGNTNGTTLVAINGSGSNFFGGTLRSLLKVMEFGA